MWKDGERAKKRQKTVKRVGQLGGKVAVGAATGAAAGAATAIGEEAVKEEGEM